VDFYKASFMRKRDGVVAQTMSFTSTGFSDALASIFYHNPTTLAADRILVGIDRTGLIKKRVSGSANWTNITPKDAYTGNYFDINAVTFNNKLFVAGNTAENRLQVYDGTTWSRVGLATPAAPTVANDGGGGTYAAVIRYYKVVYLVIDGAGKVIRRSEPSAAQSFTPSGANTAAVVTKPASISESETHWAIYGSPDGGNYVQLVQQVVGTTTYSDTTVPSLYIGTAIPVAGTFTCPPSAKYMVVDQAGIVMGGAWETATGSAMAPSDKRVWWTGTFGATDQGDDERITNTNLIKNYLDVDAPITGIGGPYNGIIYVFSLDSCYKLVGTSNAATRYLRHKADGVKGCISHKSIVMAQDEFGSPAMYWLSKEGPFRISQAGQQDLSENVKDIWDTINLDASGTICHGLYWPDRKQIWWWVAGTGATIPTILIKFDTRLGRVVESGKVHGGWSKDSGSVAAANCSVMASSDLANMVALNYPYIGQDGVPASLVKCGTGAVDIGGNIPGAYIESHHYSPWGVSAFGGIYTDPTLLAEASLGGATIGLEVRQDFKSQNNIKSTGTIKVALETHKVGRFQNLRVTGASSIQFVLGETASTSAAWTLNRLLVPVTYEGDL
jgi:hypothetical protein